MFIFEWKPFYKEQTGEREKEGLDNFTCKHRQHCVFDQTKESNFLKIFCSSYVLVCMWMCMCVGRFSILKAMFFLSSYLFSYFDAVFISFLMLSMDTYFTDGSQISFSLFFVVETEHTGFLCQLFLWSALNLLRFLWKSFRFCGQCYLIQSHFVQTTTFQIHNPIVLFSSS